jgi:very-short-patch-repair endonuclease
MTSWHRLAAVSTGQLGAFTRRQAHDSGVSDRQLRSWVQSGSLVQVGPHAYRTALAPAAPFAELAALALDVGRPCWVSGPTAAALHGFDGFRLVPPFHLTTTRERNVRRVGVVVRSTWSLPLIDRCDVSGLAATSPARTLIDLARDHPPDELSAAYDSGLRDGKFSEDFVHRRIVALRSKGRYGIPALLEVIEGREISRGGHSWLEREFLRLLDDARLPRPLTQQVLARTGTRLVRVDCRFPGTDVVVELLGYRYHRTREQLARDAERLNALVLDGFQPYQFTYDQVVDAATATIATVRAALSRSR